MERIWNHVHYNIFVWYKYLYHIMSYVSPFKLLYKIPSIKKFYAKGGVNDIGGFTQDVVFDNNKTGINIIKTGIQIGGLLILVEYGLFNFFQVIIGKSLIQIIWENIFFKIIFLSGLLAFPCVINNHYLFKNDKYLKYFKEFERQSKQLRRKWAWISFGVILGIFLFFILSFVIMSQVKI